MASFALRAVPDFPFAAYKLKGPMVVPVQVEEHHKKMLRSRFLQCPICMDDLDTDAAQFTCCCTLFCRKCIFNYVLTVREQCPEDPDRNMSAPVHCPWCKVEQAIESEELVDQLQSSAEMLKEADLARNDVLRAMSQLPPAARAELLKYIDRLMTDGLWLECNKTEPILRNAVFKACTDSHQRAAVAFIFGKGDHKPALNGYVRGINLKRIKIWFYTISEQYDVFTYKDLRKVPTRFGTVDRKYKPTFKSRLLTKTASDLRHRRYRAAKITKSRMLRKIYRLTY